MTAAMILIAIKNERLFYLNMVITRLTLEVVTTQNLHYY